MNSLNENQGPYTKTAMYFQQLMPIDICRPGEICSSHSNNSEDFCIWKMVPCNLVEMY